MASKCCNTFMYNIAICNPSCRNGGVCSAPGHCSCRSGWDGSTCSRGVYCHYDVQLCMDLFNVFAYRYQ